jgi:ABC-type amino acid transport substrate-binding protein
MEWTSVALAVALTAGSVQRAPLPPARLRVLVYPQSPTALAALQWDVLSGFARLQDLEIERVELASPAELAAALAAGKGDVAAAPSELVPGPFAWTDELVASRFVVVTRKPSASAAYVEDLRTKRVVAAGSTAEHTAAQAKVRVKAVASATAALASLAAGDADAAIVDLYEALAAQQQDAGLQIGIPLGDRRPLGFALRRGDRRHAALSAHVAALRTQSSYGALLARHLGARGIQALGRARLNER